MAFSHYKGHPWGTLISEYLAGDMGKANEVSPAYASLLYAADRGQQAPLLYAILQRGDWLVVDRYVASNMAHQGIHFSLPEERNHFITWLNKLEFAHFAIPKPTGVIVLSLPQALRDKRLQMRETVNDILEENSIYQAQVDREYCQLAEQFNWHVIQCADHTGESYSREEIAEQIWKYVEPSIE